MVLLVAAVGSGAASAAPTTSPPSNAPPSGTSGWTVYHGDPAGAGVATGSGPIDTSSPAWTSPDLDGQLYGQPLVADGSVFAATENDTVDGLDESTGRVEWSTHLGTPVPASDLPCGNIQPGVGITGTPVVDGARSEIFVVADEFVGGSPRHVLVGLDTANGAVEMRQDVDPPGADPAALLQRSGLALDGGRVVFGFGGNYGDCSIYHGWVISVPEAGGSPLRFEVDAGPGQREGAVWMGGAAPAVDQSGNIWVSPGNGSVHSSADPYDSSDSVLELSPALHLLQFFAPTRWAEDNAADLDLSTAPALLGDGQVLAAGKSQVAYLLDGAHLGGIGGQSAMLHTGCGDDIDGGDAVVGQTVFLPCLNGPIALAVATSPPGLHVLWRSSVGGGPPVVAAGLVWTIGQDGSLDGLDPATGAVRQHTAVGPPANHFPTPGIGSDVLVVAAARHLVAFPYGATTSSTSSSTAPPAASTTTRPTEHPTSGGLPVGAVVALVVGASVVVGATIWLVVVRRRRPGTPTG